VLDLAFKRRSIRQFTDEDVSDELLNNILKIGLLAPSSWGGHPVEYVVVRDKRTMEKLASCKRMGADPLVGAKVTIVVLVDREHCELWIEDGSVASAFLLLAAEYYGLGACWIQMRAREGKILSAEEEIRELLGIPPRYGVLNVIALGHKAERKPQRTEKDIPFQYVHYECFDRKKEE
jgi:nitroreductase